MGHPQNHPKSGVLHGGTGERENLWFFRLPKLEKRQVYVFKAFQCIIELYQSSLSLMKTMIKIIKDEWAPYLVTFLFL